MPSTAGMQTLALVCTSIFLLAVLYRRRMARYDAQKTDPPLLERHSQIKSYDTASHKYPGIRVFFRRHPQADHLPKDPAPIPLLVFIHGLGGSLAQFNSLLTSLTSIASCLAIDLPGCGVSQFANRSWEAYSTDALLELLETVIEEHRERAEGQGVVLIGHSYGASLAALLACPRGKLSTELSRHVVGLVGICPPAGPPTEEQTKQFRLLLHIPEFIFNLWRAWDRRGGPESASVRRFCGPDADDETKRLQDLYNNQSRTSVWRRMAWGLLPKWRHGTPEGGLATAKEWSRLEVPVFLIGGIDDNVSPADKVKELVAIIEGSKTSPESGFDEAETIPDAAAPVDVGSWVARQDKLPSPTSATPSVSDEGTGGFVEVQTPSSNGEDTSTSHTRTPSIPSLQLHPEKVVQSVIFPKPATHALLYASATAPVLASLVSDFLAAKVTGRLSFSWQLRYLCRDGKWDVKNLEKWRSVEPVSGPIGGVFRAIKTLREVDDVHCPREFVRRWSGTIRDVVDISHDNPVYDPEGLNAGGIRYHKFPTVSKVPPTDIEIKGFIELIDKIRAERKREAGTGADTDGAVVGVHCHYGYNRTGYLIVCYLVERCGFSAKEAVEHFAQARPNGIRHAHFRDRLFLRYSGVESTT